MLNHYLIVIYYYASSKGKMKGFIDSLNVPKEVTVKKVALPCLAKLEVRHLLRALETGAKAIAVWGCADQDCLYYAGSKVGRGRLSYAQKILEEIGMEDYSLQYFKVDKNNCTSMAEQFYKWSEKILEQVKGNKF